MPVLTPNAPAPKGKRKPNLELWIAVKALEPGKALLWEGCLNSTFRTGISVCEVILDREFTTRKEAADRVWIIRTR